MTDARSRSAFARLTERLLDAATVAIRAPARTLAVGLVLAVVSVLYAASSLEVRADRNAMIREGRPWNERFLAYRDNFEGTRDLLVVLRGGTRAEREGMADALALALEEDPWIERSFHRVDPDAFEGKGLLFLDAEAFEDLRGALEDHQRELVTLAEEPSLEGVLRLVDRRISAELVGHVVGGLFSLAGDDESDDDGTEEEADPVDLGFLIGLLEDVERTLDASKAEVPEGSSPWASFLGGDGDRDESGYLSVRGGELLFVVATPRADAGFNVDAKAIGTVRETLARLSAQFPDVRFGVTGERAIAAAEMRATVTDTKRASLIALAGIALVFSIGFGSVRNPLLAVAALVIGICWSAGSTTLLVGHLTVLSVAFTSILIGLGIDFGIHIVSRYEEERALGRPREEALETAIRCSGPGNVAGATTTALAFFALALSGFLGIAELGIIAGAGVLLCLLANLFMLPALIRIVPEGRAARAPRDVTRGLAERVYRRPRLLLAIGAAGVALGLAAAPAIDFDSNLLDLQAEGTEEVDLELELVRGEGFASAFAVSTAAGLPEARRLARDLEALPEVARVESLAELVPPEQDARRARARTLEPLLAPVLFSDVPPDPVEPTRLARRVDKLRFKLRPEQEERWDPAARPEAGQIAEARGLLDGVHDRLEAWPDGLPPEVQGRADRYQLALVADFQDRLETLRASTDPGTLTSADVPHEVLVRLVGRDGRLLLRIFPEENIWADEPRARFATALRAVDPEVTGIPLQMLEASKLMLGGYLKGGAWALTMVLLLLWLDFRDPRHMVRALAPLVVGGAWTLGAMALLGIDFNLANLVILPVMIGIGIDIGIHSMHRYLQDGQSGRALVAGSTGRAVLLSGLTTAIGFGTLAVARHQGLHSIGVLVGVGVLANVAAALVVLAPSLDLRRPRSPASPASDA